MNAVYPGLNDFILEIQFTSSYDLTDGTIGNL